MYDIPGAIRAVADLITTALTKFVKSTDEKVEDDRYKAEQNFKEFLKKMRDNPPDDKP